MKEREMRRRGKEECVGGGENEYYGRAKIFLRIINFDEEAHVRRRMPARKRPPRDDETRACGNKMKSKKKRIEE